MSYSLLLADVHSIAAFCFLLTGVFLGAKIFSFFKLEFRRLELFFFSLLAGFAVQCYGIWFLGRLGLFQPVILFSLYAVLILAVIINRGFLKEFWDGFTGAVSRARESWEGLNSSQRVFWGALGFISLAMLLNHAVGAHAPAVARDDLSYHLYLPKAYLEMGRIQPPPYDQRQSFFHQIMNMGYVPLMAVGGEAAVKMFNIFWYLAAALTVACISRRAGLGLGASTAAAAAWMATPGLVPITRTAFTDLPAACFILGALLAYLIYEQKGYQRPYLILCAILGAFALNKYTSWGSVAALGLVLAVRNFKKPWRITEGGGFLAAGAVLCLAPLAYYLWTCKGNPFYPVPFLGLPFDPIEEAVQQSLKARGIWESAGPYLWHRLLSGRPLEAGPFLAFAPLVLIYPSLLKGTMKGAVIFAAAEIVFRLTVVGEGAVLFRYTLPAYAVLIVLAAAVWEKASIFSGGWGRKAAHGIWLAGLILPGLAAATARTIPEWKLNLHQMSTKEYLDRYAPEEAWGMAEAVNSLPEGSKTAVLDHHFTPYYYSDLGSHLWPVGADLMAEKDHEKIRKELAQSGITHIFLPFSQWNLLRSREGGGGFSLSAVYIGSRLSCRWWERKGEIDFLRPLAKGSGGILFEFKP